MDHLQVVDAGRHVGIDQGGVFRNIQVLEQDVEATDVDAKDRWLAQPISQRVLEEITVL